MKKYFSLIILLVILLVMGCESPTNNDNNEVGEIVASKFNRELLTNGDDFTVGYSNGNIRSSVVSLTWTETEETEFNSYQLTRDGEELVIYNDISQTAYTDSLLSENQEYLYQLNVITESEISVQDSIIIKTARWTAPSNLRVNTLSSSAAILTWDDNSDSEEYFRVHPTSDGIVMNSVRVEANATEAVFTGLVFGRTYYFRVATESPYEEGMISSESTYYWLQNGSLEAPANLCARVNGDLSVKLVWSDYSYIETGFIIERKINNGDFQEVIDVPVINVIECLDSDTLAYGIGDVLTYRVKAYNDYVEPAEYSDYSNEFELEVVESSDDLIYVTLTTGFNFYECSWNLIELGTSNTVFPESQTFDNMAQTVLHQFDLEPGDYYIHCIDNYGEGGISGSVYQGTTLLTSWELGSYDTIGNFRFEVSGK